MNHPFGVVPLIQLSWKSWSLELFALSTLLLSLILSNLFLPVEMLRHSLSLYYLYYNGHFSSEFSRRIPPPLRRARATRLSTQSHPFSVQLSDPRLNRYAQSYIYSSGKVWNTLPSSIFQTSYDLCNFKRRLSGNVGV